MRFCVCVCLFVCLGGVCSTLLLVVVAVWVVFRSISAPDAADRRWRVSVALALETECQLASGQGKFPMLWCSMSHPAEGLRHAPNKVLLTPLFLHVRQ